jgi:hypothetical protein
MAFSNDPADFKLPRLRVIADLKSFIRLENIILSSQVIQKIEAFGSPKG